MDPYEQVYLDLKGLSERVPVSTNTLRSWMALGMPYRKIGGRLLFYWPSVCQWINGVESADEIVEEHVRKLSAVS